MGNTVKEYSQMIGFLTRDKTSTVPRSMDPEPRNMYAEGQLVQNTVDGSRPGYKPGGIVEPGVEYYGKLIDESPSSKNTGNTSPVKKGKFIYPRKNRWGTVYSDTPHGGAEGWEKIRTPKEHGIQIKLLEETNKDKFFDAKKFAKDNNISMKELKKKAELLQGSIYDKRMLASGKDMGRLKLKWMPNDPTISDNALSKLHKSGLIIYERNRIEELFYDAYGREYNKGTKIKNPTWNKKKHIAIKNNLTEYYQLKKAINAKYPSINFELDHPLSRSTLNKIFNASAEDLTRVNVLDAHLNNSFKDSLSRKYEKALGYGYGKTEKVGKVNLEAKKAVEKVARDLKINIGKVSTDLKDFKYGVKEFQKLNVRDEIIKSLNNQKDLNLNFKGYIKNNPELLKIAGFNDPSKIGPKLTKVTDKHIAGVTKIIENIGKKDPKLAQKVSGVVFNSGLPVDQMLKEIRKIPGIDKLGRGFMKVGGPFEVAIVGLDAFNEFSKGKTGKQSLQTSLSNLSFGAYEGGKREDMNVLLNTAKDLNLDTTGFNELRELQYLQKKISEDKKLLSDMAYYNKDQGGKNLKGSFDLKTRADDLTKLENEFTSRVDTLEGKIDIETLVDNYNKTTQSLAEQQFDKSKESRADRVYPEMGTLGSDTMTTIMNPIQSFLPQNLMETNSITRPYIRAAQKIPFIGKYFNPTSDAAILSSKDQDYRNKRVEEAKPGIVEDSQSIYYPKAKGGIMNLKKYYD